MLETCPLHVFLVVLLKASISRFVTDVVCPSVCMYVCASVTLVLPAKAVRRNELPYGRNTCVVHNNIVLDMLPSMGTVDLEFGGQNT